MRRGKAIEVMDRLTEYGYSCHIIAVVDRVHVFPNEPGDTHYRVEVIAMGVDQIDLLHLAQTADELDLDVGLSGLSQGNLIFSERDTRPSPVRSRTHPAKRVER